MATENTRIISLIASATEIVCALGMQGQLVGISHECDYPPGIRNLPVCTKPKINTDGASYEIDQRVKAIIQESLSVYRVDAELLDALSPTHIVTQSHCQVCAVSLKDVENAACQFIQSSPQIISLHPDSLNDVWNDVMLLAAAFDIEEDGEKLVLACQSRLAAIKQCSQAQARSTLAFIEWIDPLMSGGNWMPTLIDTCNMRDPFGTEGCHSPPISWEAFLAADPDVIVVAPCGFDIARAESEMHLLAGKPGWNQLKAVCNRQVFVADGNQFFNRPGPRLVESAEILAEIAHPNIFSFGHYGTGWVTWDIAPTSATRA